MSRPSILITGAGGQIGMVLTQALREKFGVNNVLASDIRNIDDDPFFRKLDILDSKELVRIVEEHKITQIYHLAAILSATGENIPRKAWQINMQGLFNVLEVAKENKLDRIFFPSSIAVFGVDTPSDPTPQKPYMAPTTVYGISKQAGEQWCQYYWQKYGVDARSLRYPGIISHQSPPGGGTTDYSVDIFHHAAQGKHFECYLSENTELPMMYIDDAIQATIQLMEASSDQISIRTSYNVGGFSVTPENLAKAIQKKLPSFSISYEPDFRQSIADTWPKSIDDHQARNDWNWNPQYLLEDVVDDMIANLRKNSISQIQTR